MGGAGRARGALCADCGARAGLPFALRQTGLVAGVALLCLVAYLTNYTTRLIVRCGVRVNRRDYEDLCEYAMGRLGYYMVSASMFTFAYGGMIAYVVILGDTVPDVMAQFVSPDSALANRLVMAIACSALFILPLSLLRDMARLAFSSFVSLLAVAAILVAVVVKAPAEAAEHDVDRSMTVLDVSHVFSGVGAMSFAFVCNHNSFIVYNSMRDRSTPNWSRVTHASIGIAFVASAVMALAGYLSFFDTVSAPPPPPLWPPPTHPVARRRCVVTS